MRASLLAFVCILSLSASAQNQPQPSQNPPSAASTQAPQAAPEQKATPPATIAARTSGLRRIDGFFPLFWDERAGKLYLEIARWDSEFLYLHSLPAGVGSNDIGLDRGQVGEARVVKFTRSGPKVLLVQTNQDFRASSDNPAERKSVEDAFAQSVLWGFEVAAEEGGRALVDATSFFLHDAHNVIATLKRTRQGTYRLEPSRSAIYLPNTRNFPRNTEVESVLTFLGDEPGQFVQQVVPTPTAITVREHYSFIQLPEPGYKPRAFDPRAGYGLVSWADYSSPIGTTLVQRYIPRHRLEKRDPAAPVSEAVKPIVYYLDPGTPEPVRSALLDGARWWAQAFEAAGFRNAYRVEMLPADADPMDVRYNVIQWVHRATRGWSYGNSVIDPRTGEIIKGHVSLGSLRVRQNFMIFEGLLAPYANGSEPDPQILAAALARLRQLSAHEVGHTLGLMHNYIASAADRASVMDYPHPLVELTPEGVPTLANAYATGMGEWDNIAIAYGYSQFPEGADEKAALSRILEDGRKRGIYFLTDQDARPTGGSHPTAHLWDNGRNAVDELDRVLKVREAALRRFGENNIRPGQPLAQLEDVLVPIYLMHRYQTEAAVKSVGGLAYTYALRGDGQPPTTPVAPAEQRRALAAVLDTISPRTLALPDRLFRLIPPHPVGYPRTREVFKSHTGLTFDSLGAAESAIHHSVRLLLDPDRAARMVELHARDASQPGFEEVLERLLAATWRAPRTTGYPAELQRVADSVVLYHLMALSANTGAAPQVRAFATSRLAALRSWAERSAAAAADSAQRAHLQFAALQIRRFGEDPETVLKQMTPPLEPPPGQPIGSDCEWEWDAAY